MSDVLGVQGEAEKVPGVHGGTGGVRDDVRGTGGEGVAGVFLANRAICCRPLDRVLGFGILSLTASGVAWRFFDATLAAVAGSILCTFWRC